MRAKPRRTRSREERVTKPRLMARHFIYITLAKLLQCRLVFAVTLACYQARGVAWGANLIPSRRVAHAGRPRLAGGTFDARERLTEA